MENLDLFSIESSHISFFADCIFSDTFTEHYWASAVPWVKSSGWVRFEPIPILSTAECNNQAERTTRLHI